MARALIVGMAILFMFGALEHWPRRLRATFLALGLAAARHRDRDSFAALFAYWVTTGGDPELDSNKLRQGFGSCA